MNLPRVIRFIRRPPSDHALFIEALILLCWVKLLLIVVPFRWVAPRLGRPMRESPDRLTDTERGLAQNVSWAVQSVARHVPLGFVCLPQAIAAKWILRRRGVASTLYLGLRRQEELRMTAHAWLRAGDQVLTGKRASFNHQAIATFGE